MSECPMDYPECIGGDCTVSCQDDPWEGNEPSALGAIELGESVVGFVCPTDRTDRFSFTTNGPAYIAVEVASDPVPGDVDIMLIDPNSEQIASSSSGSPVDVIHAVLTEAGSHELVVEYADGAFGVPYKVHARLLPTL
ncbi:MAG: hypothetical protein KC431_19445 [Myxococcales bacterium]|nr:hypothetical protein [Myxococcales bacterium]